MAKNEKEMNFWGHLEVLRWTIFRAVAAIVVCFIGCFAAMPFVFDKFILGPTSSDFFLYKAFSSLGSKVPFFPDFSDSAFKVEIININVASQFTSHISTAFWLSIVIAFPIIIYEIWKFIRPALYQKEITNVRFAFVFGTLMFYLGCAVGYCVIFPFTFHFLAEYTISQEIVNQISLSSYLNNFLTMIFIMGAVFELPLLAWLLSKLGVIDRQMLKDYRKHAIVASVVVAAAITPSGDPFTLSLVFLPLYLLYELSIRIVRKEAPQSE